MFSSNDLKGVKSIVWDEFAAITTPIGTNAGFAGMLIKTLAAWF